MWIKNNIMKDTYFTEALTIKQPHFDTPFIASFPHSSTYIPDEIIGLYTEEHLSRLRNTDWHLPELYSFLPSIGITTIAANFSRYVIDVNRGIEQRKGGKSYRSSLIYNRDTWGQPILKDEATDLKEDFRIAHFYNPFHQALNAVIQHKIKLFGCAYLIDIHSFSCQPAPQSLIRKGYQPEEGSSIYLGAGDFSEFGPNLKTELFASFNKCGLPSGDSVFMPGGHIVRSYGILDAVEACMVELRYDTYMHESSADGDHIPWIEWQRAMHIQEKLKKALEQVVANAFKPNFSYIPRIA
jgi:N-formylglutamate amidohydrolase